jgi:hypothetical protein
MARKTRKTVHPAAVLAAGINSHADRLDATTAKAEPLPDVFPDEAPEQDPAVDFDPADLFPPDRLDPWDGQSDPALWGDDTDADRWELGPDLAEIDLRESTQETGATLSLADLVSKQAEAFRAWPIEAGAMIADALDDLAAKIQATDAHTPDEYRARIEILEAEAAEQHQEIGYQEGLAAGRAECERRQGSHRGMFGHPAFED